MLIANLRNQLGDQMFGYAAIKSIAADNGYEFKYFLNVLDAQYINSSDETFGNNFDNIFNIDQNERIYSIPADINRYYDPERPKVRFQERVLKVFDYTWMGGNFFFDQYFAHRIDEVREWFTFKSETREKAEHSINEVRNNEDCVIVSIHFRVGRDYKKNGFIIDLNYYERAIEVVNEKLRGKNVKYIVFRDAENCFIDKFIKKWKCIESTFSLATDMCAISKCDAHIVCNSAFSIMAAILNKNSPILVVRPSIYPCFGMKYPTDCFPNDWTIVKAKKNYQWSIIGRMRYFMFKLKVKLVNQIK